MGYKVWQRKSGVRKVGWEKWGTKWGDKSGTKRKVRREKSGARKMSQEK